jgi:hypothetical protein
VKDTNAPGIGFPALVSVAVNKYCCPLPVREGGEATSVVGFSPTASTVCTVLESKSAVPE